jgi:hypothetical protein
MRWREIKLREYLPDLLLVFGLIAAAGILIALFARSPISFVVLMQHAINQEKRFLLHKVNHNTLARELRNLAEQQEWKDVDFNKDDPRLPEYVRSLKPGAVYIRNNDHIIIDFGGPFDAMDIRAFKPGIKGYGTKKIGDGLWFYCRNGSGPSE